MQNLTEPSGSHFSIETVHRYNEYLASLCGFFATSLLLYLIRFKNSKELKSYSPMLQLACFFDFVLLVAGVMSVTQIEITPSATFVFMGSFLEHTSLTIHAILLFLHLCASSNISFVQIQFYYRYVLICRKDTLSGQKICLLASFALFLSCIDASVTVWCFTKTTDSQSMFESFLKGIYWRQPSGQLRAFLVADTQSFEFIFLALYAFIVVGMGYTLLIWFFYKINKELKKSAQLMTAKTKLLHRQLNAVLLIQSIAPFVVSIIPISFIFINAILHIEIVPGMGLLTTMTLAWIPVVNCTATIMLIGPFRKFVLSKWVIVFGRCYSPEKRTRLRMSFSVTAVGPQYKPSRSNSDNEEHHRPEERKGSIWVLMNKVNLNRLSLPVIGATA
uniref:G protein-coupled receptor n=1 Tax=Ditylenchus dipsaci TaxID=166011 RepID=A0A915CM82_9BILA